MAIRHRTSLDACHEHRQPNARFELPAPALQIKRFALWPEALRSTVEIAQRCHFDPTQDLGYELPAPPVPDGETTNSHLRRLCEEAVSHKYSESEREGAHERLREELRLIARHDLAGFFLVYHEVMQLAEGVARELRQGAPRANTNLAPGRGRGSSVGSIVCYLIGLSHIDPVRNNLYLGRFLNEEMVGLPDIDLDFPRDIRARLFERVYEHWGKDHAAIVGLFPTYRIRSAVRDLGKALNLPQREVDRLAKFAEGYGSAKNVKLEMERSAQFAPLVDAPGWRDLIALAEQLAGFPRHLSQHVGGVVIASKALIDCVPIEPAAWPGRYVCHWDKDSIADARMVKIDFLGLGMLSLVEDCIDLIATNRGDLVDLSRIDFDDRAVYRRIHQGDTIGVFQIESRAQAGMLPRSRPDNLDDLACQVAIVRPGPITGGSMRKYIEHREMLRAHPGTTIEMAHPLLEPILRETLGAVLFQEQVLQIAGAIGGFSPGEAEGLRRALSRRDWEQNQDGYYSRFLEGAKAKGVGGDVAEEMFRNIAGFAQFGFPKSHATAFALLAYQSAWLREYFTPEFYCALYNQWPMGFYPPHVVTNDAKRHNVVILGPDINRSDVLCRVEDGAVRIGLTYVDGVGSSSGTVIAEERARAGPFRSLPDCVRRTGVRRQALEHLIQVGAFDEFGINRRELLWQLGLLGGDATRSKRVMQLQLDLSTEQDEVSLNDFNAWERMTGDYSLVGLSPNSHPIGLLRSRLGASVLSASDLLGRPIGFHGEVAGLVVCRQRPMTAKGVVFLAIEDETGLMNVTLSAELYEREREAVRMSPLLRIRVRLEGHAGAVPLLRAWAIAPLRTDENAPSFASHSWV